MTRSHLWLLVATQTLLTTACVGTNGSSPVSAAPSSAHYQVTGTAAYGHPVAGKTVEVLDSAGHICAQAVTDASGNYTLDTSSCAQGSVALAIPGYTTPGGASLLAVAVPPAGSSVVNGQVNLDPLTTALAYEAAGYVASTPPADVSEIISWLPLVSATQYANARNAILVPALLSQLSTTYGVNTSGFDPNTTVFTANGQGLDAFFDAFPISAPSATSVALTSSGAVGALLQVTAPSSSGQTSTVTSVVSYKIGGALSGLSGGSVALQLNGSGSLVLTANGNFTFATQVASSYSVTVASQPTGQTCTVSNGAGGAVTADVTNVMVSCVATPVKISFIYMPDYNTNTVMAYTYNHTTGATGTVAGQPFAAGTYPRWVTTNPAGSLLYSANGNSNNISAYTIDAATGRLTQVAGSPFGSGPGPNAMVVDPTGHFLFVADSNGSGVSAYTIDPNTGALSAVAGSPFAAGSVPTRLAITPDGKFLYVVNQNSYDISAFSVDSTTGGLTPVAGSPFVDTGAGSHGGYAITVNPTGTVLYVANWEANVSAYSIDSATGALTAVSGSPFTGTVTGWGWQGVTLNPQGTLLYVSTGNAGLLLTYSVDATTGALTQVTGDTYGAFGYQGSNYCVADPTGQTLYVSNALGLWVSVTSIDSATGALQDLPGSPFGVGTRPFDLAVVNP